MDNDNALLEAARNLYKGWRFGWKYRGVRVLDAEAGNDLAPGGHPKGRAVPLRPVRRHRDAHRGR